MAAVCVQILGSLLYVVNLNVAFPLVGRLICGMGDSFGSIATGEIVRIYDDEDSTKALWWLSSVYSFSCVCGPILVLFFKDVDFYIWSIHLTQLNFIGIFMALLLSATALLVLYLIYDCSAEFDLKEYLYQQACEKKRVETYSELKKEATATSTTTASSTTFAVLSAERRTSAASTTPLVTEETSPTIPVKTILSVLLRNVDTMLMFVSTFVFMYCLWSADVLVPLLTTEILKWSLESLTYMVSGCGLLYFFLLLIMSKVCTSDKSVYYTGLVCIGTQMCMFATLIFVKNHKRDETLDVILMLFFAIFFLPSWMMEFVIMRCMLSKMVPSSMQSFVESLRNGASQLSTVLASIATPFVMNVLTWWSASLICVVAFFLAAFIARRKELSNIEIIDFNGKIDKHDGDNRGYESWSLLDGVDD